MDIHFLGGPWEGERFFWKIFGRGNNLRVENLNPGPPVSAPFLVPFKRSGSYAPETAAHSANCHHGAQLFFFLGNCSPPSGASTSGEDHRGGRLEKGPGGTSVGAGSQNKTQIQPVSELAAKILQ